MSDSRASDLLPCPLCGYEAEIGVDEEPGTYRTIRCMSCSAEAGEQHWNDRTELALIAQQRQEIEALKRERDELLQQTTHPSNVYVMRKTFSRLGFDQDRQPSVPEFLGRLGELTRAEADNAALRAQVEALRQLLSEAADEMEENCEIEGRLSSFMALSQRIRAALQGGE